MSLSVEQADGRPWWEKLLYGWDRWPVPVQSDQLACIDRWDGPWREPVTGRKVDIDRTAAMIDVDVPVEANAGRQPYQGVSYGQPINIADPKRKVPVRNLSQRGAVLPLPHPVQLEGDPAGGFDRHLRLVDPVSMSCWEAITAVSVGDGSWNVGYAEDPTGMVRWDMSQRWEPGTSQRGVIAAGVPHTPLLGRFDEVPRGIHHPIAVVLPNYSDTGPVGWAIRSDGTSSRSPIRAGDILKLSCIDYVHACQRFDVGTAERAIVDCLFTYGMVVIDKASTGDPAKGVASLRLTLDRRWASLRPLGLRLRMFEIIQPTDPRRST